MDNRIGFGPLSGLDIPDKRKSLGSADPRLTRTNYFDGRLLTARDLIRDQHYLDDRAREVGRAIGSGIAHGLDVSLSDRGLLTVRPGLAVAPSGRVLELSGRSLYLNLYDQALLSELNDGRSQVLDNGLYAVAIQYIEVGTDSAEVYPQDLASERTFHFNSYTEGVEVVLVPLTTPVPQTNKVQGTQRLAGHRGLAARAALVPELVYRDGQPPELPSDAVALALLAIRDQRPQWLDLGLLRRPLRPPQTPLAAYQDLQQHYVELFEQVTTVRNRLGLEQDYPAALYFRHLPSHGPLPKQALDPANGSQGFFPAHIQVQVAPVREGDLPALIAESAALDPIDLERAEPAQVMVAVPMNDTDFAWRARQLQHDLEGSISAGHTRLAHIDPLALRLRRRPPAHEIDTDASVWADIWSEVGQVYYLRRPPRVAETQVSAVVLARGYKPPEPGERPPRDTEKLENELAAAREQLAKCEDALARARRALEESGGSDTELAELRQALRDAERARDTARERATEAEAEAAQATADSAELERQLNEAEDTIATLRQRLEDAGGGADPDLEARLAECEAELLSTQDALQAAQDQAALAQQQRAKAESDLAAAQARIAELEAQVGGDDSALRAQIAELEQKVIDLEADLAAAKDANTTLQNTLTTTQTTLANRTQQLTDCGNDLQAANDRVAELQGIIDSTPDSTALQAQIRDLQNQLDACRKSQAPLDLPRVVARRGVQEDAALAAADALAKNLTEKPDLGGPLTRVLLVVDARFDSVLYESLVSAIKADSIGPFTDFLLKHDPKLPLGKTVAERGAEFKLPDAELQEWSKLDA